MTTHRDPDRIIRAFLDEDVAELPARTYDIVRAEIGRTRQRVVIGPWKAPAMDRRHGFGLVAAAVVVAVAGVGIWSARGMPDRGTTAASSPPSPTPTSAPSASPQAAATPRPRFIGLGKVPVDAGPFDLLWPIAPSGARIAVTMPTGWWLAGDDAASAGHSAVYAGDSVVYRPAVGLEAHTVMKVVASVCASDAASDVGPIFVDVGPSVDDLTEAIRRIEGIDWSEPVDVTIDGHPAKRLVSTFSSTACDGPARRYLWIDQVSGFFVEEGVTSTIFVVDVDGERLVLTRDERAATPDQVAQLDAIVASMRIDRTTPVAGVPLPSPRPMSPGRFPVSIGPDADLRVGRHPAVVEGIPFTFEVPTEGWETQLGFYLNKSTEGPQNAEVILRWTTFPDGINTDPCPAALPASTRASRDDLAEAVATAPGVDVLAWPRDTTIDGHPAKHVVVRVREDLGCDPGYFYTYQPLHGGALWPHTDQGDTIWVWIVEVDDRLLVIEAEAHDDAPDMTAQLAQIVGSIRFD